MVPMFGRKLQWLTVAVTAIALVASALLAIDLVHVGALHNGVDAWERILEAVGAIAVAMLYLWREYLQENPLAQPAAGSPTAQIIQNIYPPSAADALDGTDVKELEKIVRRIVADVGQIESGLVTARRIVIADEQGRERIALGLDASGAPSISVCDECGATRARFGLRSNGHAALDLLDGESRRRAMLAVRSDGFGELAVRSDGFGELALLDRLGAIRAVLGAAGDDAISYLGLRADRTYAIVLEGREASQSLWSEAARLEWSEPMHRGGDAQKPSEPKP